MKQEGNLYLWVMPRIKNNKIIQQINSGVRKLPEISLFILGRLNRETHPQPSEIDFIEFKITCGGLTLIKSMLQFPFNINKKVLALI